MEQEGLGFCFLNLFNSLQLLLKLHTTILLFKLYNKTLFNFLFFYDISKARGKKLSTSVLFSLVD